MENIFHFIQQVDPAWAYLLLFASAFVENVFPPIPGDTVTVVGAYLVGTGILNFWWVSFSTVAGSIAGFMAIYGFAYWLEWKIIERHQPKWISKSNINRVETWFRKYGYWIILLNRFLSGARSVISLVAGLSKMRALPVFLLALISCAVWNGVLIYLGSSIGKNWTEVVEFIKTYNRIVLIALILLLVVYLARFIYKKYQSNN